MAQLKRILLPLRAVGEELGRVVELQVSDRRCQVHQSLEWSIIEQLSLPIDMEQIDCAHLTAARQQLPIWAHSELCSAKASSIGHSPHALPHIEVPLVDLSLITH